MPHTLQFVISGEPVTGTLTDTQDQTLSIYRGYFILKTYLDAIYSCYLLSIRSNHVENDADKESLQKQIQEEYTNIIAKKCTEVREYLFTLQLPMRIEVLENIYSLIFITNTDLDDSNDNGTTAISIESMTTVKREGPVVHLSDEIQEENYCGTTAVITLNIISFIYALL